MGGLKDEASAHCSHPQSKESQNEKNCTESKKDSSTSPNAENFGSVFD